MMRTLRAFLPSLGRLLAGGLFLLIATAALSGCDRDYGHSFRHGSYYRDVTPYRSHYSVGVPVPSHSYRLYVGGSYGHRPSGHAYYARSSGCRPSRSYGHRRH